MADNLNEFQLSEELDLVIWRLLPSGKFTTSSMYQALCKGPDLPIMKLLWKPLLPLKIKIFTWQLTRGRLPPNDQTRGGPSHGKCGLCGMLENVDHILFQCAMAKFMWSGVRTMFNVNWNPLSRQEWFSILDPFNQKTTRMLWIYFAA
jgi:hypothetical protein